MSHDIWSVILLSGVISWIISSIMFMLRAFPKKDEFAVKAGIRWGAASLVSFSVWILGLLNA